MKKRILSVIMVLMMVMTFIPTTAFAAENHAPPLKISAEYADGKVIVTVKADPYSGCMGAQVEFSFPEDKLSVTEGDIICSGVLEDGAKNVKSVTGGKVISAAWDGSSARQSDVEETIMTVTFSVIEGQTGECSFSIVKYVFTDGDEGEINSLPAGSTGTATVNIAAAPTAYTVTINPGANMTFKSGEVNQTSVTIGNFMLDTYFTADVGYYFPDDYTVAEQNGVEVVRVSETEIKVTGKPTNNVNITLPNATEKPAATTYTVTVNGGTGVTVNSTQTVNQGDAITDVVIEAWDDYYFPDNYGVNVGISGIAVTRNSPSKITVSGIPTADVTINLPPAAVKHENPDIPSVTPVHCTAAGNDGKITGVDASMEYKKGATGDTWDIVGNKTEITGLAPGTYYVRYKATPTQKASAPAEVKINAYDPNVQMFTITFNPNGGNGDTKVVTVPKGSNYVIQNAAAYGITAQDGMRFVYWSNREDNGQGSEHYPAGYEYRNVQSNLTFYAVWETTDRTVFLNAGEGGGDEISVAVTYDQTYTLPGVPETFTAPEGKEFDCWKIQGDNTNTSYNPRDSYTIKGNVTFVAQWKVKQGGGEQQGFTLIFQPGEGSGRDHVVNDINTQQYTLPDVPDTFTAPAGKPIFAGWKAEGGNVVYPAGTVIPVNADATFVAQWKADGPQGDTVLVTFKPGDGTGDAFELRVPAGDSYRLPAKPAGFKAPAGKVFAGWKIEDPQGNLNEKLYKAGHKFDLTEDVTFVAQWKTRPYYGDDTTPDADPMVNPGTGAAPVGAPIAVVIAVAVAGAAYFVTTKKR